MTGAKKYYHFLQPGVWYSMYDIPEGIFWTFWHDYIETYKIITNNVNTNLFTKPIRKYNYESGDLFY